eukprot:SAG22_NODE_36_length_27184_cov_65.870076_11_plen_316_part_00
MSAAAGATLLTMRNSTRAARDRLHAGWTDVHALFLEETGSTAMPAHEPPPNMFDPSTLRSTLPSWSVVSPRSMRPPSSYRDRPAHRQFSPRVTHTSARGPAGSLTSLHWSRAGSPALPALRDYTVRFDILSGRHFAVGGSPNATKKTGANPAHADDWECTPSGQPIPAFAAGTGSGAYPLDWRARPDKKYGSSHVTGVSSPKARRKFVGSSWLTPRAATSAGAPGGAAASFVPSPPPPRHSARVAAAAGKNETDVGCGVRVRPLPKECTIVGREKAVYRANHAEEWQRELDRRERDRVIVERNKANKLRQTLTTA